MTRITLSESMRAQFGSLSEPLLLCDEAGNPLGTFTPVAMLSEHQRAAMSLPDQLLDSGLAPDELRRRLREEGWVPHEEVLRKAKQYQ